MSDFGCRTDFETGRCGATRSIRLFLWALFLALPLTAQAPNLQFPSIDVSQGSRSRHPEAGLTMDEPVSMDSQRTRRLNEARQKSIASDTEKLLRLATELNAVATGGREISAADRMRKLAEIEKLARDVKQKMIFAVGQPSVSEPLRSWPGSSPQSLLP